MLDIQSFFHHENTKVCSKHFVVFRFRVFVIHFFNRPPFTFLPSDLSDLRFRIFDALTSINFLFHGTKVFSYFADKWGDG